MMYLVIRFENAPPGNFKCLMRTNDYTAARALATLVVASGNAVIIPSYDPTASYRVFSNAYSQGSPDTGLLNKPFCTFRTGGINHIPYLALAQGSLAAADAAYIANEGDPATWPVEIGWTNAPGGRLLYIMHPLVPPPPPSDKGLARKKRRRRLLL